MAGQKTKRGGFCQITENDGIPAMEKAHFQGATRWQDFKEGAQDMPTVSDRIDRYSQ